MIAILGLMGLVVGGLMVLILRVPTAAGVSPEIMAFGLLSLGLGGIAVWRSLRWLDRLIIRACRQLERVD